MTPAELRAVRDAMGLSQKQLAARLGMSEHAVYQWESGKRRVPALLHLALGHLRDARPLLALLLALGLLAATVAPSHAADVHRVFLPGVHAVGDGRAPAVVSTRTVSPIATRTPTFTPTVVPTRSSTRTSSPVPPTPSATRPVVVVVVEAPQGAPVVSTPTTPPTTSATATPTVSATPVVASATPTVAPTLLFVLAGQSNMGTADYGPGAAFADRVGATTGRPVALAHCALGGTSIGQWAPDRPLYRNCLSRVRATGLPVAGVLFYQGEADARSDATETGDGTPLEPRRWGLLAARLVGAWRTDLRPDVPVLVVRLAHETTGRRAHLEAIRAQQDALADVTLVDAEPATLRDAVHHTDASFALLGERLAAAWLAH